MKEFTCDIAMMPLGQTYTMNSVEEAVEVVIAALNESDEALKLEVADLFYHLLVVLEVRGVKLNDIFETLEARMEQSGLTEKASRSK
jgi:phosphoribosyl-ATP pyrophosphohydrolase